jgi:hypothetical protein
LILKIFITIFLVDAMMFITISLFIYLSAYSYIFNFLVYAFSYLCPSLGSLNRYLVQGSSKSDYNYNCKQNSLLTVQPYFSDTPK